MIIFLRDHMLVKYLFYHCIYKAQGTRLITF